MTDSDGGDTSLFDPTVLRHLFERLERTDIDELEFTRGPSRLYVRRNLSRRPYTEYSDRPRRRGGAPPGQPITAPLTGVYYARASPEDPPYVMEGAHIEPGQVVALIETMKLFNEVTSEVSGEIISVEVKDGDLVELGQPLMYLQVHDEENS